MNKKIISIWGSTGSIGTQSLDIISRYPDNFDILVLTANKNVDLLFSQAERFHPQAVVVTGRIAEEDWQDKFKKIGVEVLEGKAGLLETAGNGREDIVVNALVGGAGLEATMRALKAGVSIALANKEVLVMAGELVTEEAKKQGAELIPIDSEHNAIFQCLQGEDMKNISRIILTASGGPFYNTAPDDFKNITVEQALDHPNWSMGRKVTIDSATLMNKGLEVMEARWFFGQAPDKIEVVVHPQSIIHSMVEFIDGSVKAQLGVPDMRIPISYALSCPDRIFGDYGRLDFSERFSLDFLPPDTDKFPALQLAYQALEKGGTAPAVLNAADEIAVELFLNKKIDFTMIPEIIDEVLQKHRITFNPDLKDIIEADKWARNLILTNNY